MGLIHKEDVIELIMPRLNSAKKGSLEHQRLSSILLSVEQLSEITLEAPVKEMTGVETTGIKDSLAESIVYLLQCFPQSFVNSSGEFIAHGSPANEWFRLDNCNSELDIKCKVLEQLSRGAYKTEPYATKKNNEIFHVFMRDGINRFLGTDFSHEDMEEIYIYLGNGINREKTLSFIESGYDVSILCEREVER